MHILKSKLYASLNWGTDAEGVIQTLDVMPLKRKLLLRAKQADKNIAGECNAAKALPCLWGLMYTLIHISNASGTRLGYDNVY